MARAESRKQVVAHRTQRHCIVDHHRLVKRTVARRSSREFLC